MKIKPEKLRDTYMFKVREKMEDSREIYPEVRVEEILPRSARRTRSGGLTKKPRSRDFKGF